MVTILAVFKLNGAVCVSTGNGTWNNSSTWSCGSVPACGDSIVILSGHTVSITAQDYDPCALKTVVVIKGTLRFTAPGKLELSCLGRVYIFTGGQIIAAVGQSGNSNAVMQCGSTWWNAGAGTYNGPGCMPPFLTGCSSVLPVELLNFDGKVCENRVCISWQTATEHNHDFFEILRSGDGSNFYSITKVYEGGIQFNGGKRYAAQDPNPLIGINYYRLKQVDKNGDNKLYPLIAVNFKSPIEESFRIDPNPNKGHFRITSKKMMSGEWTFFRIYDHQGKKVLERTLDHQVNEAQMVVDFPLAPGIYFAELIGARSRQIQKLIISP